MFSLDCTLSSPCITELVVLNSYTQVRIYQITHVLKTKLFRICCGDSGSLQYRWDGWSRLRDGATKHATEYGHDDVCEAVVASVGERRKVCVFTV